MTLMLPVHKERVKLVPKTNERKKLRFRAVYTVHQ